MTHRFPHDFWSGRPFDLEPGLRFDASRPQGLGEGGPYGFSRNLDWDTPLNPQEELLRHFIDETGLDDIEFDDEPLEEGPHACVVDEFHPTGAMTGFFIPEKYEPNYAYPLIVWFHDRGHNESTLLSLMPRISERNAFGLSLRGTVPVGSTFEAGFDWPNDSEAISRLEASLYQTVCEVRRNFHIHSERVFLAGSGRGASLALRLLFNRPEWFGGAFALGGELPVWDSLQPMPPELSERPVFLAHAPNHDFQQHIRLWRAAGLNLLTEETDSPTISTAKLSQLNQWLMGSICTLA